MTAAKYNITIDQGSDFLIFFTLKDSSGGTRNITGYEARASMRPLYDLESSTSYDFSCGVTDPGTTGKIIMSLSSGKNSDIPAGLYAYDLEIFNTGAGSVERVIHGRATLRREVTR